MGGDLEVIKKCGNLIVEEWTKKMGKDHEYYQCLRNKLINVHAQMMDSSQSFIQYTFQPLGEGLPRNVERRHHGQSHIAELPPIFINGQVVLYQPVMNIMDYTNEEEFLSSVYHEWLHYLSIQPWILQEDQGYKQLVSYSGIVRRSVTFDLHQHKRIIDQGSDLNRQKNEYLNDVMAAYYYEKIEKRQYHSGYRNRATTNKNDY